MDQLLELINSMTKMEKRHFVTEQKKQTKANHIFTLYQEVNRQSTYDESYLKNKFSKKSFVKILPTIKNQLYKALIRSMGDFHRQSNIDFIIRSEFTEIDILIKKKLYNQALKKINSIKKPIEKYERFTYHMELILKETEIKYYTQKNKDFSSEITRSITTARSVGRDFYVFAYQKLMLFRTQSMLWNGKDFSDINYNPLRETNTSKVNSANYYHLHHSLLYLVQKKDFIPALGISDKLIQFMELNTHEFEDNPEQKIDVWYACGMVYLYNNKQDKLVKVIENISQLKTLNLRISIRKEERLIDLKLLQILINSQGKEGLISLEALVNLNNKEYSNFYAQKFWDTLASIYLKNNDYRKALKTNYNNLIFKKTLRANYYYNRAILREIYLYYVQEKYSVFEARYKSVLRSNLDINLQEKTLLKNLKNDKNIAAFKAYLLRKKKS